MKMDLAEDMTRPSAPPSDMPLPAVPRDLSRWALFLDIDGTLLDIAPSPDAVRIPPDLPGMLDTLREQAGGALALVTGREIRKVDEFFAPICFPVAGVHGAELRMPDGSRKGTPISPALPGIISELQVFVDANPGLLLERKARAVAVHYRQAPELGDEVEAHVRLLVETQETGLEVQPGKMVVEIRPHGVDKGRAIELFMEDAPYAGRLPLVIGDDWTDEAAFRTANARGGVSIRVGRDTRPTEASARLLDPTAVRAWLASVLESVTV
ncbi:trehalose-phosphatase [Flaviflagellibacter deserti]|jgi:trehalose 6-phosphate phosphatase|uniref:Trehalose 6-phosphate phosphatase n=1 Tax=Flaviflagellibacter deserti TaxID=2267266 RepID=A0ABV9Z054_9HYPH